MLRKVATAAAVLCFGVSAFAAGFDGRHLTTNDWFDADFTTGIAADTAIESGSTTGITRGAGSWTAVPATGTAKVVADSDVGGEATMLAINAPGEELTFTPAALESATGMETSSLLVKGDAVDELPAMGADVQAAFAIYDDGTDAVPCGYTAAGWTNLEYTGAMSGLTNAWCTVYVDFANVENVRYVRYSVQPAGGEMTILADADGTTWFQAGCNATTITSVSLSGIGSCRTINGDSLEETVSYVATYNGVSYQTLEEALAAGLADNWANGSVILVDDVTWRPTVRGAKYLIDRGAYTLDIVDANVSVSANNITNTVNGLAYYWIGGGTGSWTETANWSLYDGGAAAGAYPNSYVNNKTYAYDSVVFTSDATVTVDGDRYAIAMTASDGATVTLTGGGSIKTAYNNNNGKFQLLGAGTFRMNGVRFVLPYATSWKDTATIETPIVVVGTSNTIYFADSTSPNMRYSQLTLATAISGSGELKFDTPYFSQSRLYLGSADFSGFTGTMAIHVQTPTLPVQGGGTYVIGSSSVAGGLSTVTFSGVGGTLAFAAGVEGDVSAAIKNSTAAITVDTGSDFITWATALAASNVGGLTKTGVGTLMLTAAPDYTGTTTVEEGTLVVPGGTTIETLSVGEYASFVVSGDDGEMVTITEFADGTTVADVTATPGLSLSWVGSTATITRSAQTFVWTGAGGGVWNVSGNWATSDGTPTLLVPLATDAVSFTNNAAVTLSANVEVASLSIEDAKRVVFAVDSSATRRNLVFGGYVFGSDSTLALANIKLVPQNKSSGYNLELGGNIEIVSGTTNEIRATSMRISSSDKPAFHVNITGELKGDGVVTLGSNNDQMRAYVRLSGDNSGFSGEVRLDGNDNGSVTWVNPESGSASARWVATDSPTLAFGFTEGTIELGSFEMTTGMTLPANSKPTLKVGGYGNDFELGANFKRGSNGKSLNLVKTGTGKMVFSGKVNNGNGNGDITIEDGILDIAAESALPQTQLLMTGGILAVSGLVYDTTDNGDDTITTNSISFVDPSGKIKNCTTWPITFSNAVGEVHTWATALADSNTDGLVKKGAGTLMLEAMPLYSGKTYLDDGALKVPQAWARRVHTHVPGKHAEVTVQDGEYKVYELVDGEVNVPTLMLFR